MHHELIITIFGFDSQSASLVRRRIKDGLDGLDLSINFTIIPSEARSLFGGEKEPWILIIYQESKDYDWNKVIKTVMDTTVREAKVVLLPVSGIVSQNKNGIY